MVGTATPIRMTSLPGGVKITRSAPRSTTTVRGPGAAPASVSGVVIRVPSGAMVSAPTVTFAGGTTCTAVTSARPAPEMVSVADAFGVSGGTWTPFEYAPRTTPSSDPATKRDSGVCTGAASSTTPRSGEVNGPYMVEPGVATVSSTTPS